MHKWIYALGIIMIGIQITADYTSANFVEATGLPTSTEFNFSTQIERLGNSNLILMHAQVSPTNKLQFYTSNDSGASRNNTSSIPGILTYGGGMRVLNDGTVLSIMCNYTNPGGIYRSTDNGLSWSGPLTTIAGAQSCIHGDFLELNNGSILAFVGGFANIPDVIYRSTDGGNTWTPIVSLLSLSTYKLAVTQLTNGDIILANIGSFGNTPTARIRRSTNNGSSRTLVRNSNTVVGYDAGITQANDGSTIVTFATVGNDPDTYRSTDNGQTRTQIGSIGGNITYYGTDIITLTNGILVASFVDGVTKRLYRSIDNGISRTPITRPTNITTISYANDLFEYKENEFLISDGHWGNRPIVYQYLKPLPPVITNLSPNICAPLATISGIGEGVGNTITYDIKDTNNTTIRNGTAIVDASLSWSATFADINTGLYTIEARESDTITSSDTTTIQVIINDCNTSAGPNQAPIIQSNGGGNTTTIQGITGATMVTTVRATDNGINVVGIFGKTITSGNMPLTIDHGYDLCQQVVTTSHRQAVNAEIQRYPRVINKTDSTFTIRTDNYTSTIGSIPTIVDYVAFGPGTRTFTNGLQVQANTITIPSTAVACRSSPNGGLATQATATFTPAFTTPPAVLHTISSYNDPTRVMSAVNGGTRQNEPSTSFMGLHMGRSFNSCTHGSETIDYIAREQGHRSFSSFEVDAVRSSDSIRCCTSSGNPINFFSPFSSPPPTALVAQLGEDGGNGSYAMIHTNGSITTNSLPATVDEEGPGADRGHTTEVIASVAFSTDSDVFTETNTITYSIAGGADAGLFTMTAEGVLSFVTAPDPLNPTDANNNNTYEVIVSACDSHCNQQCDTQLINVVFPPLAPPEASISRSGSITFNTEPTSNATILTGIYSTPTIITFDDNYTNSLYTTLSISDFSGFNHTIPGSIAHIKAGTITTITGGPDPYLSLASDTSTYQTFDTPITRWTRTSGTITNGGSFGTLPSLKVTIPPYTIPDSYQATITYTLYEN